MMVNKGFRRQGIGAALMQSVCREGRDRGMKCAVLSASSKGKALYEQVGFSDAGRYGSYFPSRAGIRKHC